MNRILLISGGLLIVIFSIIRFYAMTQSELTQVPVLIPMLSTYAVMGVITILAGIADKYWLTAVVLFFSILFLLLNLKFLLMGEFHYESGVIIRIIGFSISIGAGVSGMINYLNKKHYLNKIA